MVELRDWMMCPQRMVRFGAGQDGDAVQMAGASVAPLLLLDSKEKALGRRKVRAHRVRPGNGQRSYNVRFQRGTRSTYLSDTLLKTRRRS